MLELIEYLSRSVNWSLIHPLDFSYILKDGYNFKMLTDWKINSWPDTGQESSNQIMCYIIDLLQIMHMKPKNQNKIDKSP